MTPSVDPAAGRLPAFEPVPPPVPVADPFEYYLSDEFTRELTALVRRGQKLAEAEAGRQDRHERP